MDYRILAGFLLTLLCITGCTSIGPSRISADRKSYNDIVRETDYQQILTNIVRLSYVEPTLYLKVTSITSSYSLSSNLSATPSWTKLNGNNATDGSYWNLTKSLSVTPSVTYSDAPTISYVPVDDAAFVTMMHQPVSFEDIVLLFNDGINDIDILARLAFNRVGNLDNASSATTPRIVEAPRYQAYYRFVNLLVYILQHQMGIIDAAKINGKPGLILHFLGRNAYAPPALEIKRLLNVSVNSKDIIFVGRNTLEVKSIHNTLVPDNNQSRFNNLVYVQTRSANAMLAFLSHSVHVPASDASAHMRSFRDVDGRVFNWNPLMYGLMQIYCSNSEPANAFVKTYVHHHWFYISNADIASKVTFTLLVRLMTLISGYGHAFNPQVAPFITVPVGARAGI